MIKFLQNIGKILLNEGAPVDRQKGIGNTLIYMLW